MSAESPRHARAGGGGPLTVASQPPSDRSLIDAVSGFINDVTLSAAAHDPKDVIQWARFETADINEPVPEGDSDNDISPLLLILGYGSGVQVWLIPPSGDAQEVLSWRQGTVRVLRILPTPQHGDAFAPKRPLIALCDSASAGASFCSLSFISIRGGEQVKSIKFKNPILDVLANKRSVVVSFSERFAVFDAATLEDRLAVTTCYPCPCPLGGSAPINPLALGDRWIAYADKKLNQSKRSSGGCEGEGQTSYTATVLHAAKSLSKGLRGLGESVAHSLAGTRSTSQSPSPPNADAPQPGVVTILDIESNDEEDGGQDSEEQYDPIVAHFVAHSEAIIALKFDPSGMLLVTADRRGHDFHVFRINPHPCGPALASVHHLYILHRGDTTAKVQDIAISLDSRWVAISTLRGTTHMFAMSPYGGACTFRTHTAPRVVNRLSRFHRSAGLPIHAGHAHAHTHHATGSPVSEGIAGAWFPNPRLPPYPVPVASSPLAQLRPTANLPTHTITRTSSGRQRLSSLSEESSSVPLLARARFGVAPVPAAAPGGAHRAQPAAALYLMAHSGCLSHIALHPRPARNVPKEKISDDTPIELDVEPIAQWPLQRPPAAGDLLAPLPPSNPLLQPLSCRRMADMCMSEEERWLSQVEIVTHAGPHRRLWMGPQFVFKTYNCTGSNSSLSEAETVEVEPVRAEGVARSNPVNMPAARPIVPVLIDSGSASSLEHSPVDGFRRKSLLAESGRAASVCDVQLKEDLAEAMKEDHGGREAETAEVRRSAVSRAVDPIGTVVEPRAPPEPEADSSDEHTRSNDDEATFRPVVRAPAPPDHSNLDLARPLPHTTTIPVQSISALGEPSPPEPHPLSTDVIIPAALTPVPWSNEPEAEARQTPPREVKVRNPSPKPVQPSEPAPAVQAPEPKPRAKETTKPLDDAREPKEPESEKKRRTTTKIDKAEVKSVKVDDKKRDETPVVVSTVDSVNVDVSNDVNKDLKRQEIAARRVRSSAERTERIERSERAERAERVELPECAERTERTERAKRAERDDSKSLPKRPPDDIHPTASVRIKKSPTPKSVSDRDSEASSKDKPNDELKNMIESKELKETKDVKETKEIKKQKDVKESRGKESREVKATVAKPSEEFKEIDLLEDRPVKKEQVVIVEDEPALTVALKAPVKKEAAELKPKKQDNEIKTEEQAWDMLLNEPEKPIRFSVSPPATEDKPKSKKGRKIKKSQDDAQTKADDDSFVEIHAIEEKQPVCSGELVSISTPFEDVEPTMSFLAKTKKSRKSLTPEKKEESKSIEILPQEEPELLDFKPKSFKKYEDKKYEDRNIEVLPSPVHVQKEIFKDTASIVKSKRHLDGTASESSSFFAKEISKPMKSKSLSPYSELRKHEKPVEIEKDVYVINTAEEEFPEIQITRGAKPRKRSPQPIERKVVEQELVAEKPVKSWSSIAASKNVKKEEDKTPEVVEKSEREEAGVNDPMSSTTASLQDKLIELCKRTDIMVAECDAPSELNFVEEHHAVLHDLPPLEPLDFGLDDFKLEVMRDSLLEVNDTKITSPICKINIDDILSSIKETTARAIESSAFNLIDLEKVPAKKEKGFSVIEEHKITSQEVKLDDDGKEEKEGEMEKSSEDDTSPVVSTDSDKEERKNAGASNIVLPSLKQSAKSKKSRRKKK